MRIFILVFIIALSTTSCSPLKVIQQKSAKGLMVEKYQVKKIEESVKEGRYTQLYKGVKLQEGVYATNKKTGVWKYYDYNGKINFSGNFENDIKNGLWTYYYKGQVSSKIYYNKGIIDSVLGYYENNILAYETKFITDSTGYGKSYYPNGHLKSSFFLNHREMHGVLTQFFENGKLHRQTEFDHGVRASIISVFDPLGNPIDGGNLKQGNGSYHTFFEWEQGKEPLLKMATTENYENGLQNGPSKYFQKNGKLLSEGLYKNGNKSGEWKLYKADGSFQENVNYEEEYKVVRTSQSDGFYLGAEEEKGNILPEFQGGEKERVDFIIKNIVYPKEAVTNKIQGTVYVNFIITQTGELESFKIIKSVNPQMDNEVIELLKKMPRWNPGLKQGVPVRVWFNMPIKYSL